MLGLILERKTLGIGTVKIGRLELELLQTSDRKICTFGKYILYVKQATTPSTLNLSIIYAYIINSFSVMSELPQSVVIVDGHENVYDPLSVDVWNARTALLSLILGGDTIDDVQTFLECLDDVVLEFTLKSLKSTGITTWSKQEHRFGIAMM